MSTTTNKGWDRMIITVYSSKGGVGKTPIAANILFDNEDFYIATNERNSGFEYIERIDDDRKILINPEDAFEDTKNIQKSLAEAGTSMIIDLSGSLAETLQSIPTALGMSQVVIVPINDQHNSLIQGITTIQDIHKYYPHLKVIVAATKLERQGPKDIFGEDWEMSESFVNIKSFIDDTTEKKVEIIPLKFSKGYNNLIGKEMSLKQLAQIPFGGHAYKVPAKQFELLYKTIGI